MTAIWPAGPPKVCSEMANQTLVASRNAMTSRSGPRVTEHVSSRDEPLSSSDWVGHGGKGTWSRARRCGCAGTVGGLEQFDQVAGGVGEEDLSSAGNLIELFQPAHGPG